MTIAIVLRTRAVAEVGVCSNRAALKRFQANEKANICGIKQRKPNGAASSATMISRVPVGSAVCCCCCTCDAAGAAGTFGGVTGIAACCGAGAGGCTGFEGFCVLALMLGGTAVWMALDSDDPHPQQNVMPATVCSEQFEHIDEVTETLRRFRRW